MSRKMQAFRGRDSTRRTFITLGVTAAVGALASSWAWPRPAPRTMPRVLVTPLARAYLFLRDMMDLYATGTTLRLVQSYKPTAGLNLADIAFIYDNAVMLIALLIRGQADDLSRATLIGDSLIYAQNNDSYSDGRVRDGYHVNPFKWPDGSVHVATDNGFGGSDTGNLAWCGISLMQLYGNTRQPQYLNAALGLGAFIQTNAYDARGPGGYTGGLRQDQTRIAYKSTEHNIDLFSFFTMLSEATADPKWSLRAKHALDLVESMWNSQTGFFWTGTLDDGTTINQFPVPEDAQTWSYLSTGLGLYQRSIDWVAANLAATNTAFSGVSFSQVDRSGVWFEGTAHLAAALQMRNLSGDSKTAALHLKDIEFGQANAPHTDGNSIDAASKDGLSTGYGFNYYAAPHIGATSWYCLAKQGANPFHLP